MPSYSMTAELFTLEKVDFDRVLYLFMRQEMHKAVKVYLRACLGKIPVRTGFVKGSFTNIARRFGIENSVTPTNTRNEFYRGSGQRILKTTKSGIKFAVDAERVLVKTSNGFEFKLDVDINYYRINDFFTNVRGTPWESLNAGAAAMTSYLEQAVTRFPDIAGFVTKNTFTLSSGRLTQSVQRPNVEEVFRTRDLFIQGFE